MDKIKEFVEGSGKEGKGTHGPGSGRTNRRTGLTFRNNGHVNENSGCRRLKKKKKEEFMS